MNTLEQIEQHLKTHTKPSDDDISAVSTLQMFLRSNGKINTNFSSRDKWPNTDGTFEYVSNPELSRKPEQNFFVQIKGTQNYSENDGIIKYSLKSLAFPAFIFTEVTADPGILFVVLNSNMRGKERVFWKYMSIEFLNSIDYTQNSVTISFNKSEEIENTNESVDLFCQKLSKIVEHHSFVKKLENREYSKNEIERIIEVCDTDIKESIERLEIYNDTRDNVSRRILSKLYDLCSGALLLNAWNNGYPRANLQLAWELASLNIETKYLNRFLRGLKYIGNRIPEENQSERLMLVYYDFLWQIRNYLQTTHHINILDNLEKFPHNSCDVLDFGYYNLVANAIENINVSSSELKNSQYFIYKKTCFYVNSKRYYEITLQLASPYASKYNRITVYSKENISTNYSIRIAYQESSINLWGVDSKIKYITSWKVAISPRSLNGLARVLRKSLSINSKHIEYDSLMTFLTKTGINFLDLIDLKEIQFTAVINEIYKSTQTSYFKDILLYLKKNCSKEIKKEGNTVIRYLLFHLREQDFEKVEINQFSNKLRSDYDLSSKCYPFDKHPFLFNLTESSTSKDSYLPHIINVSGDEELKSMRPAILIKQKIKQTGEIYFNKDLIPNPHEIEIYNSRLDSWDRSKGVQIKQIDDLIYIDQYEQTTTQILQKLLNMSKISNAGQEEYNKNFLRQSSINSLDSMKKIALKNVFVHSQLLLIYGAAGTGKTTLINYISNLMSNKRKLFLTKTYAALQNLKRRIENPGVSNSFVSIDSFNKKVDLSEYDVIFVDECSTISNLTMLNFLSKISENTFLVLAGDIYQIESIDFGNWFYYAKNLIQTKGANVELLSTWRTEDKSLKDLWEEVRNKKPIILEKLVIDGPFSNDIGQKLFNKEYDDEAVLCLNYDGKFGLNNLNNYFQNANLQGEAVSWQEWTYKRGDYIIFSDTKRFSVLYNNLKGQIYDIEKEENKIWFTVDVETFITERDCQIDGIAYIGIFENKTRIKFDVLGYKREQDDVADEYRKKTVVPFQLAYAVSIHKAQGLEYDSVKIVIPDNISERITHNIFYTAITRAKKKLAIYWSSETMKKVIQSFFTEDSNDNKSLEIIKSKLTL